MFNNILILGHSNIGDVCYDLSIVVPLHRSFPQARISFLTSRRAKELAQGYSYLNEVITFDKHTMHRGILGRIKLIKDLRARKFDLGIVLKDSLSFFFLGLSKVWHDSGRAQTDKHAVDTYLDLLCSNGIEVKRKEFCFGLTDKELSFANSFFRQHQISPEDKVVAIGPLSNWSLKCWPLDNWNRLIETLVNKYNLKIVVLGKPGEDSYSKEVVSKISKAASSSINQCTLKESMAIIKKSNLFIGCDTSLLHIGSCLGIASIGLYGPTPSGQYFPYFHKEGVIVGEDIPDCAPCLNTPRLAQCKEEGEAPCMQAISVERVLSAVKKALGLQ